MDTDDGFCRTAHAYSTDCAVCPGARSSSVSSSVCPSVARDHIVLKLLIFNQTFSHHLAPLFCCRMLHAVAKFPQLSHEIRFTNGKLATSISATWSVTNLLFQLMSAQCSDIIVQALILSKITYALLAFAGLTSVTSKTRSSNLSLMFIAADWILQFLLLRV